MERQPWLEKFTIRVLEVAEALEVEVGATAEEGEVSCKGSNK